MTWAALLLADPSPCLRWLVLTQLLARPLDDPEAGELAQLRISDRLFVELAERQAADGSWESGALPGSSHNCLLTTSQAMLRLGFLGFDKGHPVVQNGADYIFRQQASDGSWQLPERFDEGGGKEGYDLIPLQTAFPLRGLAACGFATDPRAESAYEWLIAQRLDDSAWPTGISGGSLGYVAGYRRMPHSRWGCRSNTTGVLCCLALHPQRRHGEVVQRALDLLLGRGTQEASNLGFDVARTIGAEPFRGFFTYFARFDLGLLLRLCAQIGASLEDERVAQLVDFIRGQQNSYGLWEFRERPQASRWVTFDVLHALSRIDQAEGWVSLEPPTSYKPEVYGKQMKRH